MLYYATILVTMVLIGSGLYGCAAVGTAKSYYEEHCEYIGEVFTCKYVKINVGKVKDAVKEKVDEADW